MRVYSVRKRVVMFSWLATAVLFFLWLGPCHSLAQGNQRAVIIPVEQGIERGLEQFLKRAFADAAGQNADLVILDIDTPGGEVNAAANIGQMVREAPMKVVAFIDNHAFSAGTYIALNADEIVMTPGSTIGAATPVDLAGNAAEAKLISGWSNKMAAAAELNHRDPNIARAMVEIDREIPGIKPKGTVLSLTAEQAGRLGYADRIVADREELYQYLGVGEEQVMVIQPTLSESIARMVTSPLVMSLLLIIGFSGLALELFVPGFGIPGIVGLLAFFLYFFGHYAAGFANFLHLGLFLAGIVLILAEIVIPGGIVGGIGLVSLGSGLVLAAYDTAQGLASLGLAALVTAIVIVTGIKYFGFRGVWNKLILRDEQRNEQGYVAPKDQRSLLGQHGIALTPLRPAGVVKIGGMRVDAVSEGGFIPAGREVKVVTVEGTRVVVEELDHEEKEKMD